MNLNERSVSNVLGEAKRYLKEHQVEEYELDAELLFMDCFAMNRVQIFTKQDTTLGEKEIKRFECFLEERGAGQPVQYILGHCEFMGLEFMVNKNVLIPRQDTEVLVEVVCNYMVKNKALTFIDVGTGSGCIPISVLKLCQEKEMKAVGLDISQQALEVAKANAKKNYVENQVEFIKSDVFSGLRKFLYQADVIVSNPPYIRKDTIGTLMREVKDYEPWMALDGGEDGLFFYEKICCESRQYLKCGGALFFEIGYDQKEDVMNLMKKNGFKQIQCQKDYAGLDRVVWGIK